MSDEPAIRCEQVTKTYRRDPTRRLRRSVEHRAVDAVDLEIGRGETVGILGHNGAGKTTLLKLLAGVTAPSAGRIVTRGRVVPLISVGVGFHGELSGHENVRVNATILGLTAEEIDHQMESIIDFAELAGSMDQPVKFFSTGMQLRLAFAVAMHARPDVLLLDEILAVGDTAFQLKCLDRMADLQRVGTTIVFVSQSVHAIRLLCPRAAVMDHGRLRFDGTSSAAVGEYHRLLSAPSPRPEPGGTLPITIEGSILLSTDGTAPDQIELGSSYVVRHSLRAEAAAVIESAVVVVRSEAGTVAHRTSVAVAPVSLAPGEEADLDLEFTCRFAGGTYRFEIELLDGDGTVVGAGRPGAAVYRTPALGSYGVAEFDAEILLDDRVVNDHRALEIGQGR